MATIIYFSIILMILNEHMWLVAVRCHLLLLLPPNVVIKYLVVLLLLLPIPVCSICLGYIFIINVSVNDTRSA